jgi:hypothetical protein
MSKKKSRRKKNAAPPARRFPWLWLVVGSAILLIGGGISFLLISGGSGSANGTPKLVVEQTVVDEGYIELNTSVRTSFTLRNEGDGLLRVLGEPQVQLVEGC